MLRRKSLENTGVSGTETHQAYTIHELLNPLMKQMRSDTFCQGPRWGVRSNLYSFPIEHVFASLSASKERYFEMGIRQLCLKSFWG